MTHIPSPLRRGIDAHRVMLAEPHFAPLANVVSCVCALQITAVEACQRQRREQLQRLYDAQLPLNTEFAEYILEHDGRHPYTCLEDLISAMWIENGFVEHEPSGWKIPLDEICQELLSLIRSDLQHYMYQYDHL